MVKNLPANAGDANAGDTRDVGLIPGSGRSLGGGNSNPLQYSYLENSVDRGARWATVHRVSKNQMTEPVNHNRNMRRANESTAGAPQLGLSSDPSSIAW